MDALFKSYEPRESIVGLVDPPGAVAVARLEFGSVMQSAPCIPVATRVHGWGSITVQCRQQVNTPCRLRWHAPAYMDVWKTFLVPFGVHQKGLACRGETRPGGSKPQQRKARKRSPGTNAK